MVDIRREKLEQNGDLFLTDRVTAFFDKAQTVNYGVKGYGQSVGPAGWFRTDEFPPTGVINGLASQVVDFPFDFRLLPKRTLYNAIVEITCEGSRTVHAVSNIDNNSVADEPILSVSNIYWVDLVCFGLRGKTGDNTKTFNYVYGTNNELENNLLEPIKIRLLKPDLTSQTITAKINRFYSDGTLATTVTKAVLIPAGDTSAILYSGTDLAQAIYGSTYINFIAGHYEITLTSTLAGSKPALQRFYWGFSEILFAPLIGVLPPISNTFSVTKVIAISDPISYTYSSEPTETISNPISNTYSSAAPEPLLDTVSNTYSSQLPDTILVPISNTYSTNI